MRTIRSMNTTPEITVRAMLRRLGYVGYRLHKKNLPGKPDIVFVGQKKVLFVHGCFWHGHHCKRGNRIPTNNRDYWLSKIERNRQRHTQACAKLEADGWRVLTLWECMLRDSETLAEKLNAFLSLPTKQK